jgi:hypothetical protein
VITVYTDPLLLDFVKVCINLPEDERRQLEDFTGEPYDIDRAAVGNYCVAGPKWVIKADEEPICIGGFVPQRPGVYRDFMLNTPAAFEQHWFAVTRIARRSLDAMLLSKTAHRLECIAHHSREKAFKWYSVLGYNKEATLYGYCADQSDAVLFSRVEHR